MQKIVLGVDRAFRYVAIFAIVLTMVLTSVDALSRYLAGRPLRGSIELITDYALPMMVFLAAAHAYRHGGFIRVTLLRSVVPARVALAMDMVAQVCTGLIALLFTYASLLQAIAAYRTGALSNGVYEYPLWPAYWIVVVGMALMTVYALRDIGRVGAGQSGLLQEAETV